MHFEFSHLKKPLHFISRFAIEIGYGIGLCFMGGIFAIVGIYFFGTPDAKTLPNLSLAQTSIIYDRTGTKILYKLHGEENRKVLSHDEIPDIVREATVATEDGTFYSHHGVDVASLARAVMINFQAGKIQQGGSTITQQLARNAFFSRERTYKRKILETIMAFKIENNFSKDEILDMYLNRVPYGANTYGIGVASETYFGKPAKDLSIDESALLASLTKAPSLYSPYVATDANALSERDRSLQRMTDAQFITENEKNQSMKADTLGHIIPFSHPVKAPHFVFYILDQLEQKYGREYLETGGLKIITTLDWSLQEKAERAVTDGVAKNISRDASNAALTAIDPKTGEILAMVGSKNFFDTKAEGEVNVAVRTRQPGSSFKPLVYAAAFEKGFQPETILTDKFINFGPDGSGKDYIPQNYNFQFHGNVSMRSALAQSLNIPAVQTLYLAGLQSVIDTAHSLGITTLNDKNRFGLSLALGSGEVSLLDMTSAFGVFAQDGMRTPTHGVFRITDQSNSIVEDNTHIASVFAITTETARKVTSILSDNNARSAVFGSNSPLILPDRPVAAKTGTTQDFHDAWTIGYTPSLAVGVWAGNNDRHSMKEGSDGVYVAAPIWHDFMHIATMGTRVETFNPYTKITSDKLLITGNQDSNGVQYYNINSGKKISPEKAAKKDPADVRMTFEGHSILYYVNKNDPLGPTAPDYTDPMLPRWENSFDPWSTPDNTATSGAVTTDGQLFMSASDYYKSR